MRGWKQVAIAAVLVIAAGVAWARLAPGADVTLERTGMPPALVTLLAGKQGDSGGDGPGAARSARGPGGGRDVLVVTAPVASGRINDRVSAIGDGDARRSITVVPLSAGIITRVHVESGDRITAGAVLAELDSDAERIAHDRAELARDMAQQKLDRYQQLVNSRTVSAVQLDEARNEFENARLALRDAALKLARRSITAPIDGIVGIVPVEVGDYVTTNDEIATLDDRSRILVDFWVPERFAGVIRPGQPVEALAIALPGRQFEGEVEAVASRIDRDSRTLRVRAGIDNERDDLRPGMSFKVTMHFPGEDFPAVNPLAVQWSSDGAFVWKEEGGLAVKTPVRVVQRNSDWVLVDGELARGDSLVIEGVQSLREGSKLRIAGDAETSAETGS
ncbi:MAG: efflux RND transporter periplasmic adaptor subunit [Pseudomonadota bacterium]|nr:efflux RND transporter periplasmic adaptor subunit [Pseudomonadota bacterium]